MEVDERLRGLRCIGQIRCSRKVQARKSLPQQENWLREVAAQNSMTYVADMQEAISASQIKKRPDLERIFERKRILNDFDVVLVQDLSRLTRGGPQHGLKLFFRFQAAGLKLVSIADGYIEGDDKIIEAARRFQESRATAKATAMVMRRGFLAARARGRIGYTFNMPFGVDRVIKGGDGSPRCIIRKLRDGTTQQLALDGVTVLQHFTVDSEGDRTRYIKQVDETEDCVLGDPANIAIVNHIFKRMFVDGKNAWWICRELNDQGILSPNGKQWSDCSLKYIVTNPIYLGTGYADRHTKAIFYMNSPKGPTAAIDLKGRQEIWRDEEEWFTKKFRALDNFLDLDASTKQRIAVWQSNRLRKIAVTGQRKLGGDRHVESTYFLKDLLRNKKTKKRFYGTTTKQKSGRSTIISSRYYRSNAYRKVPVTGDVNNRMVNASAIEPAVKSAVLESLKSFPHVEQAVIAAFKGYANAVDAHAVDIAKLRKDRAALLDQISYWVQQLSALGQATLDEKVVPLKTSMIQLDRRIREAEEKDATTADVTASAKELSDAIEHVKSQWDKLPPHVLHRVLTVLVSRLEIDMETFKVEMDLRIPSWAAIEGSLNPSCLVNGTVAYPIHHTYTQWDIPLGNWTCETVKKRPPCFVCSRSDAAKAAA